MKSGSGSPTTKGNAKPPLFTQSRWRVAGGVCIAVSAVMAWYGAESTSLRTNMTAFGVYWLIFAGVFFTAMAMVLLDLRYIRLQYKIGKREIFHETLGDEAFRRVLKQELRDYQSKTPPESK